MCLACSTPVRGLAYGSECLSTVLGSDAPPSADPGEVRPERSIRVAVHEDDDHLHADARCEDHAECALAGPRLTDA